DRGYVRTGAVDGQIFEPAPPQLFVVGAEERGHGRLSPCRCERVREALHRPVSLASLLRFGEHGLGYAPRERPEVVLKRIGDLPVREKNCRAPRDASQWGPRSAELLGNLLASEMEEVSRALEAEPVENVRACESARNVVALEEPERKLKSPKSKSRTQSRGAGPEYDHLVPARASQVPPTVDRCNLDRAGRMDNLAPRAREYWCVREFQDAGDGGRTPHELARQIVRSATDARPSALLSFDFEDWYQLACRDLGMIGPHPARQAFERQVQLVLDLLDEIEATATFFVLGMSAERHPELVCELVARKHEVACHGHEHFRVFAQTEQEFRYDVERAIDAIAGTVGRPPRGYRPPWRPITRDPLWAYAVFCDLGLESDSSQYDAPLVRRRLRSIPRGPYRIVLPSGASLLELPISIWGVGGLSLPIGGGAYMRAIPPPFVRHGLRHVARARALLPLCLHPPHIYHSP